ncbi:PleD family two-component system response regulator [Rhodovibrionaceae bacterium A322]
MTARILVVDDIPPNVKLLEAKLMAEYFDVLKAYDGPSALEIAKEESPDLILLDVMMPGMDGFEVCQKLRSDPETRFIPVVMITALSDVSDRVRGLEAGADDFLSKPVNDISLFARVRSLVRLKTLMDELRTRQQTMGRDPLGEDEEESDIGAKILVIDGEPYHAQRTCGYLRNAGYEVQLVEDCDQALDIALERDDLDLAIVGLDVNGQDGLRFSSLLRSHEKTRHVPVLLVLDDVDLPRLAKGLDLGVSDYLFKPMDRNELLARVRTQVRWRRYHRRLRQMLERSVSMAYTDALTGAFNRRYLNAHLDRRLMEIADDGKPVSIMMFDIDNFKAVNDTYGHAVGDDVLTGLADRIRENVRPFDLLARYGGEEFVLIMPGTNSENAFMVADRLREKVCSDPFKVDSGTRALTVAISAGVTTTLDPNDSAGSIIQKADEALYKAKREGRNRVIIAETGEKAVNG